MKKWILFFLFLFCGLKKAKADSFSDFYVKYSGAISFPVFSILFVFVFYNVFSQESEIKNLNLKINNLNINLKDEQKELKRVENRLIEFTPSGLDDFKNELYILRKKVRDLNFELKQFIDKLDVDLRDEKLINIYNKIKKVDFALESAGSILLNFEEREFKILKNLEFFEKNLEKNLENSLRNTVETKILEIKSISRDEIIEIRYMHDKIKREIKDLINILNRIKNEIIIVI